MLHSLLIVDFWVVWIVRCRLVSRASRSGMSTYLSILHVL